MEDLREECSKYGQVLKVVVPRPPVPQQAFSLFNQQNYGKVWLRFCIRAVEPCCKIRAAVSAACGK